jgi:hypothetical protein
MLARFVRRDERCGRLDHLRPALHFLSSGPDLYCGPGVGRNRFPCQLGRPRAFTRRGRSERALPPERPLAKAVRRLDEPAQGAADALAEAVAGAVAEADAEAVVEADAGFGRIRLAP